MTVPARVVERLRSKGGRVPGGDGGLGEVPMLCYGVVVFLKYDKVAVLLA